MLLKAPPKNTKDYVPAHNPNTGKRFLETDKH